MLQKSKEKIINNLTFYIKIKKSVNILINCKWLL